MEHSELTPRIAGEPPARVEKLALELFGASIDRDMVIEILNRLRTIGAADNHFESWGIRSRTNLIHEVLAAPMEAP